MNVAANRIYWVSVGFVMFMAAAYLVASAWQSFGGRVDEPAWSLFFEPASWLFPLSLMHGVLLATFAIPRLGSSGIDAVLVFHALLTLGMAVWFYRSRRAPLRLRVAVLAGLLLLGVAARLLVFLLIWIWAYS